MVNKLSVKLLYLTACYPQMDGQNEQTNQTVEIVLQFLIATLEDLAN